MNPRVKEVIPVDNYTIFITFDNGEQRIFDVKPYLDKGIFYQLRDIDAFKTVKPFMGSIQWGGGQDFCPDTLYSCSVPVTTRDT
ncbi:DUF2442 domain-containing protein [Desulfonatronum lacustre]|uniref:DUF2442 domain-containing protein n=1 Tax=Desulfonatronum lacustre TaxID=66849 RepID=UPI00048EA5E4|nr:DUF2442 domain-containing protein [Desulfonatronum lacustre]